MGLFAPALCEIPFDFDLFRNRIASSTRCARRAQLVLVVGDQHDDDVECASSAFQAVRVCLCVCASGRTRSRAPDESNASASAQSAQSHAGPPESHQVQWNNRCTKRGRIQLFRQRVRVPPAGRGQNAQNSRQIVHLPRSRSALLGALIVQIVAVQKVN